MGCAMNHLSLFSSTGRGACARRRRGLTLIELLVVVAIMTTLMAVSLPILNPVAENRVTREGVRALQSALDTARMRASRLKRPCGLALVPYDAYPSVCLKCDPISCPPNYCGDALDSTCNISTGGQVTLTGGDATMLKAGNWIQFNHTGPWYRFSAQGQIQLPPDMPTNYKPFWSEGAGASGLPFAVRQYPVGNSANGFKKALGLDPPVTFPRGVVIDLYASGVGVSGGAGILASQWGTASTSKMPIMIMFNPGGGVEIYYNGQAVTIPVKQGDDYSPKIYLMVGHWSRGLREGDTLRPPQDGLSNVEVASTFWLVINPRTGLVTSAPNSPFNDAGNAASDVVNTRRFARSQRDTMGSN